MTFQIHALDPAPFEPLYPLSDAELRQHKAEWRTVTDMPGFPCRVTLQDAPMHERVLLINHTSVPGSSPYAATHAVFIRPGQPMTRPPAGTVPDMLKRRTQSLRAFTREWDMINATVIDGISLEDTLPSMFHNARVQRIHIHNAAPGCYAAQAVRAA